MRNVFRTFSKLFVVVLVATGISTFDGNSQGRRQDQVIPDDLYHKFVKRSEQIDDQLAKGVDSEWAGTYADGDHHPTVFVWEPKNGFVVNSSLHTFSPSWVNFGSVQLSSDRLRISSELSNDNQYAHKLPPEFVLVKWDKWHILVPPDQLINFAYSVHSGSEAQIWRFFVKWSDREESRSGLPKIPTEYRKYMVMPAITARILKVVNKGDHPLSVEYVLNVGARQKVIAGMQFYHRRKGQDVSLVINEVSETTSTAMVSMIGGTNEKMQDPSVGWRFTSKIPKNFIEPG